MIPERYLTIITGVLLFVMMGLICARLADCFSPDNLYPRPAPTYTNQSYEDLQREKMFYEKSYKQITKILGE